MDEAETAGFDLGDYWLSLSRERKEELVNAAEAITTAAKKIAPNAGDLSLIMALVGSYISFEASQFGANPQSVMMQIVVMSQAFARMATEGNLPKGVH